MENKKLNYTVAITELEQVVRDIEAGEVDVDVLAEKVKRSAELIKFCNDRLKGTQDAVNKVLIEIETTSEDEDSQD